MIRRSALTLAVFLGACSTPDRKPPASTAADTSSFDARKLAAMRAQVGPAPAHLDGFRSRDSLVAAFARAVDARDTTALRRLALTPGEFAYLYYPDAPLSKPPYDLDAETMWIQVSAQGDRGFTRVLRFYGGRLGYEGYSCTEPPVTSGALTLWSCQVRHSYEGRERSEPLFGSVVQRDGWFKFVSLANRL